MMDKFSDEWCSNERAGKVWGQGSLRGRPPERRERGQQRAEGEPLHERGPTVGLLREARQLFCHNFNERKLEENSQKVQLFKIPQLHQRNLRLSEKQQSEKNAFFLKAAKIKTHLVSSDLF